MMMALEPLAALPVALSRNRSARHKPPAPRAPTRRKSRRERPSHNRCLAPQKVSMAGLPWRDTVGRKADGGNWRRAVTPWLVAVTNIVHAGEPITSKSARINSQTSYDTPCHLDL